HHRARAAAIRDGALAAHPQFPQDAKPAALRETAIARSQKCRSDHTEHERAVPRPEEQPKGVGMRTLLILVAVGLIAPAFGSAAAKEPQRGRCGPAPPPFETNAANQIKGEALLDRLSGRTMAFTRMQRGNGGQQPRAVQFRAEFRADGSTATQCRVRRRNTEG